VTVIVDGWHGDTSRMYGVGEVGPRARRLVEITYEGMKRGLDAVKPGATLGDIGYAIQSYVEAQRCSVVRDFCGHGLGKVFHDAPNILHFGRPGQGAVLKPGMFFTVEPMVNLGKPAREGAGRRLDGRDPRQVAVGPVRALDRRDRRRLRGVHRLARRPVPAGDPGRLSDLG
jgi:methionine aminopeptidase